MRPSRLDPLFASARTLPGVGPKIGALIAKAVAASKHQLALVLTTQRTFAAKGHGLTSSDRSNDQLSICC